MEKTVKFKVEKETKNTVKYNEVPAEGQPPVIGTLYVQKWFAGNAFGSLLWVRIGPS